MPPWQSENLFSGAFYVGHVLRQVPFVMISNYPFFPRDCLFDKFWIDLLEIFMARNLRGHTYKKPILLHEFKAKFSYTTISADNDEYR